MRKNALLGAGVVHAAHYMAMMAFHSAPPSAILFLLAMVGLADLLRDFVARHAREPDIY